MGILLVVGMFFYSSVEGWSLLDSLYFCVVTLGTVGYGDLSPTTPGSKIFTIAYVMLGLSFFVTFVSLLTKDRERIFERREQEIDEKRKPQAGDQPSFAGCVTIPVPERLDGIQSAEAAANHDYMVLSGMMSFAIHSSLPVQRVLRRKPDSVFSATILAHASRGIAAKCTNVFAL